MLTKEKFNIYHSENPEVYKMFEKFTLQAIESGRQFFGAKAIMERVRWSSIVEARNDQFKVNNNFVSFYCRMFEERYGQYKGFFKKRRSVADKVR